MDKKIFITGGAGFIGSWVVAVLLEKGYQVLVLDNLSAGKKDFLPKHKNLLFIKGDILNAGLLKKIIREFSPNFLVHLAALHFIPLCNKYPKKAVNINIGGTEKILDVLEETLPANFKKILVASSAAIYSPSAKAHKETEMGQPTEVYSFTKHINEIQLKDFYQETKVDSIAMRIFNTYGPQETNPHLIPEIIRQIKKGEKKIKVGNTKPKRSYVYVKDVAKAVVLLLESERVKGFNAYNIGSEHECNACEIIKLISKLTNRELTYILNKRLIRKFDPLHLKPSLEKIKRDTSWQENYNIKSGLKELLKRERIL